MSMLNSDQEQNVASGGVAVQAKGDITITTGLSYSDARTIALDVFNANFYKLADSAAKLAVERAEEITDKFLSKLQSEAPARLVEAQDPDFQYALLTVQKEYARTGDKDLGDLLVDLLVDRSKYEKREILQIVLNEALNTAPKLTESQMAVLALIFLFKYTQNYAVGNHDQLGVFLDRHASPFISKVVKNQACYQHLEFCGCGSISIAQIKLETVLGKTYQGLFLKGFDRSEIANSDISMGLDRNFFINCLNEPSKLQVNALNMDGLDQKIKEGSISPKDRDKITRLFETGKMSDEEIKEKCTLIRPYMSDLFESWSASSMQNLTLTSVGIAIGHANIKRYVGEFADLSIWIN
jgi:hypothetical protein